MKQRITIAIPAFNEEQNIQQVLKGIIRQKENDSFSLVSIRVYSDGSTDRTVQKAKQIKDRRIQIHDDKKRRGKSYRLNQICHEFHEDILILLDADAILTKKTVVAELIKQVNKPGVGLVSGVVRPVSTRVFLEKAIYSSIKAYHAFAENYKNGINIYTCKGAVLALSREFASTVTIPQNTFANDAYLYFLCIQKGFTYGFAKHAVVYTRLPRTVKDHILQNTRFESAKYKVSSYFGDFVMQEFSKGKSYLYLSMLKEFFKEPVESFAIFFINIYCKFLATSSYGRISSMWNIAQTTKGGKHA